MTTDKLKPCPFCGHEAYIRTVDEVFRTDDLVYRAECEWCCGNSGWYSTESEAADAWNMRN